MRILTCLVVAALWAASALGAEPASGRIIKVLPHFLDLEGRHTLSPSLYERDAYQAYLRRHPAERSGLRVDVQWKSARPSQMTLRLQLRGRQGEKSTTAVLEGGTRKRGLFSQWSALLLEGDAYRQFGELTAWRATLWEGETLVSEQKSFLWDE